MRELLKEYYGLEIEYSRAYYDGMIFFINGDYYYLCKCYLSKEDVDKSYKLYLLLKNKGLFKKFTTKKRFFDEKITGIRCILRHKDGFRRWCI